MSIQFNVKSTLGFHNYKTVPGEYTDYSSKTEASKEARTYNLMHLLGYIPLVGLITCYVYSICPLIHRVTEFHNNSTASKISFYIRGILAGIGAGILFLLPDLFMTAYRFATTVPKRISYFDFGKHAFCFGLGKGETSQKLMEASKK